MLPSRFVTRTFPQPVFGSLPDMRQTFTPTMFEGRSNQSGLSPLVAVFMNDDQIGTARSPAYPFGTIVFG